MTRTDPVLHVLQHSMGLDDFGRGRKYRNRFVTGPCTDDWPHCEDAVARGLMERSGPHAFFGGSCCFSVTPSGEQYIREQSPKPPKISAGRKRYLQWIEVADAFPDWTFGDWLKNRGTL